MSTSGNRVDPNLKEENIRQSVTMFGIVGTYFPSTLKGNPKRRSVISETGVYNNSGRHKYLPSYLGATENSTYAFWFYCWDVNNSNIATARYTAAIRVNKTTGESTVINSGLTNYGLTSGGNYFQAVPTSVITDGSIVTFTRIPYGAGYDGQITFNMSTGTRGSDIYTRNSGTQTIPAGTDILTNIYYNVMGNSVTAKDTVTDINSVCRIYDIYLEPELNNRLTLTEHLKLSDKPVTTTP